jgi:3-phenylpropionate/cinnamic acid dioxygenase small subunit
MAGAEAAITRLLHRYAEAIDAGDFDAVADLFAEGEITAEGSDVVTRGRAAVRALYDATTRIYPETGTPRTKHVVTNVTVEVDETGETARATSYFTVLQATPRLALQPIVAGRYRDAFVFTADEWRFARRHIICELFGDVTQHLLIDVSGVVARRQTP